MKAIFTFLTIFIVANAATANQSIPCDEHHRAETSMYVIPNDIISLSPYGNNGLFVIRNRVIGSKGHGVIDSHSDAPINMIRPDIEDHEGVNLTMITRFKVVYNDRGILALDKINDNGSLGHRYYLSCSVGATFAGVNKPGIQNNINAGQDFCPVSRFIKDPNGKDMSDIVSISRDGQRLGRTNLCPPEGYVPVPASAPAGPTNSLPETISI
jgi:hypothetical protein